GATQPLDELRAAEYARLDEQGEVYLDYTGAGLYADRQVHEHLEILNREVLGNPHSDNPTSRRSTDLVEQARAAVLEFFNAAPDEYTVVFTANASAALKLVGEAYPFSSGDRLLLTADNHNSVNGLREFARARGARVEYVPALAPELRVVERDLGPALDRSAGSRRLFAYPAQSNFSGVQHPLAWIEQAHDRGWEVLLDAAAFAPTNRLDLGRHRPDFVTLSFYKLFGYPTGIGCLIARHETLAGLRRPWFAGGTVIAASVQGDRHYLEPGASGFEDGTINFLGIPAVPIGLRQMQRLGLDRIHERVRCLTGWLLASLPTLRHPNGAPLIRLYGPRTVDRRGGTIAFNVLDADGHALDVKLVERLARERRISLRTGCFCNPGASEAAFGLEAAALLQAFAGTESVTHDQLVVAMGLEGGGAIRISAGAVTNLADVGAFLRFLRSLAGQHPV
ncbi:MAG TPA: aminotransferase class V-fold PLP-dependent enzyme, partial [Dehalococcoidia bacterium]